MGSDDYSNIDDLIDDSDLEDKKNYDEEDENGFDDLEDFSGISGDDLETEEDDTESEDVFENEEE